jgi:hypothetical protein
MFEKKVGVDVNEHADRGDLKVAVCVGTLAAAIVGRKLTVMAAAHPGAPVTSRSFPLPRGRIVAIGIERGISLVMANGDLLYWWNNEWTVAFNLADEAQP